MKSSSEYRANLKHDAMRYVSKQRHPTKVVFPLATLETKVKSVPSKNTQCRSPLHFDILRNLSPGTVLGQHRLLAQGRWPLHHEAPGAAEFASDEHVQNGIQGIPNYPANSPELSSEQK